VTTNAQPAVLPPFPESFAQMRARSIDALAALAEANQRVVGKLMELSSAAARESFQAYIDMQSAALDAVRTAPTPAALTREVIEELQQDPLAWYRKSLVDAVSTNQRMAGLFETNAKIFARGAKRLEASAEETAREIGDAVKSCMHRMKEIQESR
jgi:hypothetical protein